MYYRQKKSKDKDFTREEIPMFDGDKNDRIKCGPHFNSVIFYDIFKRSYEIEINQYTFNATTISFNFLLLHLSAGNSFLYCSCHSNHRLDIDHVVFF